MSNPNISADIILPRFSDKSLTNKQVVDAEQFGGTELGTEKKYKEPMGTHYSDKPGHKDRSIAHDPKHLKHWQKVKRESSDA